MSSRSTGRDAVARDAGLGFARTPEVVMIQIFGRAQYVTGEPAAPRK